MPQVESHCFNCQKAIKMEIQQTVIDCCLRWYTSYVCPFCGAAVEADDTGKPPEEIRQSILSEEGEWNLVMEKSTLNKIVAIKILRQDLSLSLAEAGKILKRFPDPIISGTKIEMEWLKKLLAIEGVQAAVVMQNRNY